MAEPDDDPPRGELLLYLAHAHEQRGAPHEALRAYLESVLEQPDQADRLLPHAHRLLTATFAASDAAWIMGEWWEAMQRAELDPADRLEVTLFLARMNLFAGQYSVTLEILRDAELPTSEIARASRLILSPESLPHPLAEPGTDGNAHLVLARLNQALGRMREALTEIELALEHGVADSTDHPTAPVERLKAELMITLGHPKEAATAYYEAGRRYVWRDEYATAIELLRRAIELLPDHVPSYWSLSSALYQMSYAPAMTADRSLAATRDALQEWDRGLNHGPVEPAFSWSYVLRALLIERIADLEGWRGAAQAERNWEGVTCLEKATLLNAGDAQSFAYLGRFHRSLYNESVAAQATAEAVRLDGKSMVALEERAAILADLGAFAEADAAIEERRQLSPSVWADAVKAFILVHVPERAGEGFSLIESAIRAQDGDAWYREIRALGCMLKGTPEEAERDYRFIWDSSKRDATVSRSAAAWAGYFLGMAEEAAQIFHRQVEQDVLSNRAGALRGLGLCHLDLGHLDKASVCLTEGVRGASNIREIDDFLRCDLLAARARIKELDARQLLREVEDLAALRRGELEYKTRAIEGTEALESAIRELEALVGGVAVEDRSTRRDAGIAAGLARLYRAGGHWRRAVPVYQRLLRPEVEFPEAKLGLARCIEELQRAGDDTLRRGEYRAAHELYSDAIATLKETGEVSGQRTVHLLIRVAYASLALLGVEAALPLWMLTGAALDQVEGAAGPSLGETLNGLVANVEMYWLLRHFLDELARRDSARAETWRKAGAALAPFLEESLRLAVRHSKSASWWPSVTPIAVELGQELMPPHFDPEWPILKTYLPQMRERISGAMGVPIPGVRLRPSDALRAAEYVFLLNEIPLLVDSVPSSLKPASFAAGELGREASGSLPSEVWDGAHGYVIAHLERFLSRHVGEFLTIDAVEALIDDWRNSPDGAALVEATFGVPAGGPAVEHLKLMRLLRALVDEGVSISPWREILKALAPLGQFPDAIEDALQVVRLQLKAVLPGNRGDLVPVRLPAELEMNVRTGLRGQGHKRVLALPPEEAQTLLSELRVLVSDKGARSVLVVEDPGLRPFVRRLVQLEFPELLILSAEELVTTEVPEHAANQSPTRPNLWKPGT